MTHKIYKRKKRCVVETQNEGNNTIQIYHEIDQKIRIQKDQYGKYTNVNITSYLPYGHFPKYHYIKKVQVVYDEIGYVSDFQYTFISGKNKFCQKKHYIYDENHFPAMIDIYYIENNEIVCQENIKFHATYTSDGNCINIAKQKDGKNIGIVLRVCQKSEDVYEIFLPTGLLSCSLIKAKIYNDVRLCKIENLYHGKYLWRLLDHTKSLHHFDDTSCEVDSFEVMVYEPIFTVDLFSEIYHYAKANTKNKIEIGIYGVLFVIPQKGIFREMLVNSMQKRKKENAVMRPSSAL